MQAQIDTATNQILATGLFPAGSPDPAITIVDVPDSEMEKLTQPGDKFLGPDGTVRVDTSRLEQQQAEEQARQQAATAAAAAHKQEILTELVSAYEALSAGGMGPAALLPILRLARDTAEAQGVPILLSDLPPDIAALLNPPPA